MAALRAVETKDLSREQWLEYRKKGIGGSDIAAICGLSPWQSPMAVYLDKIGEAPEKEQNEAMYWGTILEDVIAEEFTRRTGLKVQRQNAILQHPEHPWMLANIDRKIVGQKAGLECKTTSAYGKEQWKDEQIPDMYMLQCQWYMAVTGFEKWWLAVLIGGNTYIQKEISRDQEMIDRLIQIGRDFWTLVENRTPPAIDGSESSTEVINILFPPEKATEDEVSLSGNAEAIISDFLHAQELEKTYRETKEEAANRLKLILGERSIGFTDRYRVTWRPVTTSRVDANALKKDGLYDRYCKQTTTRRFLISELKEDK